MLLKSTVLFILLLMKYSDGDVTILDGIGVFPESESLVEYDFNVTMQKVPWYKETWLTPKQVKSRKPLAYKCLCGVENTKAGKEVYPWVVWTTFWTNSSEGPQYEIQCSGTLINDLAILTNAKCANKFKNFLSSSWYQWDYQRINVWMNNSPPNPLPPNSIPIANVHFHPDFVKGEFGKDVAILELKHAISFLDPSKGIRPICLPALQDTIPEVLGTQAGLIYNMLDSSNNTEDRIPQTATTGLLYSLNECKKMFKDKIQGDYICSGPSSMLQIPAQRHFGAPMYSALSNDQNIEIGIWSSRHFGIRKNEQSTLNLFIRILDIVPFIEDTSNQINARWCRHPRISFNASVPDHYVPLNEMPWINAKIDDKKVNPTCVCGYRKLKGPQQSRIVGGHSAIPHSFPWMINMQIAGAPGTMSGCGAAIINNLFVLTAAHCVINRELLENVDIKYKGYNPQDISLILLSHTVENDANAVLLQNEVEEIFLHPDFAASFAAGTTNDYDVALLKLNSPLEFFHDDGPLPICLPSKGEIIDSVGHEAIVTGWGMINPDNENEAATELQQLEIPIKKLEECIQLSVMPITNRMLCAGTFNPMKDTLHGDSGGPLMLETKTKQFIEIGIVSWGDLDLRKANALDTEFAAALYTNTSAVLDYIDYFSHLHRATWCRRDAAPNPRRPWEGLGKLPPRKISSSCVCGKRTEVSGAGNIAIEMEENQMPWVVMIMAIREGGTRYCSGTIINDRIIITSAECVKSDEIVKQGKASISKNVLHIQPMFRFLNLLDFQERLVIEVIYIHPGYLHEGSEFDHDIAVIKLKQPINFQETKLSPVCIPTEDELTHIITTKGSGIIAGWQKAQRLRQTTFQLSSSINDIPLRKSEACGSHLYLNTTRKFICLENLKTATRDQSMTGGPLLIQKSHSQLLQIGIIPDLEKEQKIKCAAKKKVKKGTKKKHDDQKKVEDQKDPVVERSDEPMEGQNNSKAPEPPEEEMIKRTRNAAVDPDFFGRRKRNAEIECSMFTTIAEVLNFIEYLSNSHEATWCTSDIPPPKNETVINYGVVA